MPSMGGDRGGTAAEGAAWAGPERRRAGRPRIGRRLWRLLRWYYALKYRPFRRERRPADGRRGLVMLQIDALSYADLRRGLELGYCPNLTRLLTEERYALRRWFCGLPSATPYCQAGIFHGENAGIPAFRFYVKAERRVITCNAPEGVQFVRDRIHAPGALAEGSSYVNLLDGDARTVAFTVATRERASVYHRLGGTRMALLIALHPVRVARIAFQAAFEWVREEWERLRGEMTRRTTHAEGIFPFVRILTNVVVRELQTMAILLDVYLGVPVVYSTYMQYDELAHHFGPSSRQALSDLKRTDARIGEIMRMIRSHAGRPYDLVVLSDHGMTPSASYRVEFGETLGRTVQRALDEFADLEGEPAGEALESHAGDSEYADVGARVLDTVAAAALPARRGRRRRALRAAGDWLRRHYGLREILFPEKFFVDRRHDVVVTYSSCLALVYFADDPRPLEAADVDGDARRRHVYRALLEHRGVGLVLARAGGAVRAESRVGRALLSVGADGAPAVTVTDGESPLAVYAQDPAVLRAVHDLLRQEHAGDLVVFGAFDGYEIVSFDDQVGAHGSAGGDQVWPFMLTPPGVLPEGATLENARDVHRLITSRYAVPQPAVRPPAAGVAVSAPSDAAAGTPA